MRYFIKTFLVVIYIAVLMETIVRPFGEQHFSYLALSFWNGKLDINNFPWIWDDSALFMGSHFWPLGPFPSIFLMPFVYLAWNFGFIFYQRYIHWLIVLGVFALIYKIARKLGFTKGSSLIWAFAFNLGSSFINISLVPFSWYFSQAIVVLLIFASLYEYLGKRRYFLIGACYAAIFLTRTSAVLGALFYLLSIFFLEGGTLKQKLLKSLIIAIPIVVAVVVYGSYNYLRFGNALEQGYSYQILGDDLIKARSYGMLGLIHIPGNLYYMFLASPLPVLKDGLSRVLRFPYIKYDLWGLGIFYTSPYLLKLFTLDYKKKLLKNLLITSTLVAIPILLYYGIGVKQYGYRYALDFIPYLFLILMAGYGKKIISTRFRILVGLTIVFNLYLLYVASF